MTPTTEVETGLGDVTLHNEFAFGDRSLTEWRVDHEGYVFVVGLLRDQAQADLEDLALDIMDTWEWLPVAS